MTTASALAVRARRFDRALLLVVPAAAFMLLLFVYPFLYGLVLSFDPKEGGALANYRHFFTTDNLWPTIWTTLKLALPATLINVGLRAADRLQDAREVALPALGDDDPGGADHAGHGADRRRHADLFRPQGLAVAVPAVLPYLRGSDPPHAQLLGRADLAGHLRVSLRVPADPVVHHRHRSGARARGVDAGRATEVAVPPHLSAAARAGTGDVLLPRLRAGVLGVPVRRPARLAGGSDAGDIDRGVRGGVRAIRLFARLGDRDDHGLRATRSSSRRCWACATCSTAAR